MFDLSSFDLASLLQCSTALRGIGDGAESMEGAASAITAYLHEALRDLQTDKAALALVRLYKTHNWDNLEPDVAARAAALAGPDVKLSGVPCLTLLGSAGSVPAWNDRHSSQSHQAIPLVSPETVASSPMVAALFSELGLDAADVAGPDPALFRPMADKSCGVFYVAEAAGSSHVPDQDFVRDHSIRSVVGFGGVLPDGHMFAVVMFATVPVQPSTADGFTTLAFSVNLALLPFVDHRIFASDESVRPDDPSRQARIDAARVAALTGLLDARQHVVVDQAAALERGAREARERAEALALSRAELAANEAFKTAILDAATESIITIGDDGRVLEFNAAAQRTFGLRREDVMGRLLADLIIPERQRQAHEEGLRRYLQTGVSRILNERIELNAVRADGSEFPIELTVSRAAAAVPPVFVGSIRDLTSRKAIESALAEESRRASHIARTLQTSLLPPALPDVPGLELAASYRPAGEGYDVGGDFYDVFEIGNDDWAFVLGDVMGKGPEAAVVTALARYTIRAAAIRARKPAAVLDMLNAAINRQHPERSCTAVYGRMRTKASGIRLTLGSGGHVPALLRRADGQVTAMEATGTLLGPFPTWSGKSQSLELNPGDLVLAYSDGVTDARSGAVMFGEERLKSVLAATAGMPAEDSVREIEYAIEEFCPQPADDIAMLAVRVSEAGPK